MKSIPAVRLLAAFETLPHPRRRRGRRFSLAAILSLGTAAMLANLHSALAMAEWAADHSPDLSCGRPITIVFPVIPPRSLRLWGPGPECGRSPTSG